MKVLFATIVLGVVLIARLFAEPGYLAESDHLSFLGKDRASIDLLRGKLADAPDPAGKAQIYWRLARDFFGLADSRERAERLARSGYSQGPEPSEPESARPPLDLYKQCESYADQAIALDPADANGYYWKAAAVGKIAQIENLLRAFLSAPKVRDLLFKAARLDPQDGEVWYVLAQLYSQIPGFPLSFGNTAYAVSLGRKGLAAREAQVAGGSEPDVPEDYHIQLARELVRRGWSLEDRRARRPDEARRYREATDPVEKNFYYEGIAEIPPLSDRQEAIAIDRKVAARLHALSRRSPAQEEDLQNARRDLTDWTR